ncbi:KLHL36 [Symbiodinium sp. CCMP2456]|nr:KLHL36 [Symbiodinium sp. CCMP2456]
MATTIDTEVLAGYISLGNLEGLRKFAPSSFDWSQPLDHEHQVPALVLVIIRGLTKDERTKATLLQIAEWLLKAGADPSYKIPQQNDRAFSIWKNNNKPGTTITVEYKTHSAVSFAFALLRQMQEGKGGANWSDNTKYLEAIVALFARTGGKNPNSADVTVPQSTLDFWESIRELTSSHNVIFEASDGEVSAHHHALAVASPVLKAMLTSAMKEGTTKRIQVKDSSSSGVSLFLDVLYTSSAREEPDNKTTLVALDLAHRWQVHRVVQILCPALCDMIDANSFAEIAEAAALMGLETLQRACVSFASTSEHVQRRLKNGSLPAAVRKLLGEPEHESDEQQELKKRRRWLSRPS